MLAAGAGLRASLVRRRIRLEQADDRHRIVTKLDWINPHAYVYLDGRDAGGEVRNYKVEMGPPYALVRGGWKRDTVKIGDTVTITGAAAAKDGSDAAGSMPTTSMTLAAGQKLVMR